MESETKPKTLGDKIENGFWTGMAILSLILFSGGIIGLGVEAFGEEEAVPHEWELVEGVLPAEDGEKEVKTATFLLKSNESHPEFDSIPRATLSFYFVDTTVTFGVIWSDYIGSETCAVKYKIGSQVLTSAKWKVVEGEYTNIVKPNPKKAISILQDMLEESEFVITATKHDGSTITANFNIAGTDQAIKPTFVEYFSDKFNEDEKTVLSVLDGLSESQKQLALEYLTNYFNSKADE